MDELTSTEKLAIRERIIMFASKTLDIPYKFGAEWTDFKDLPIELDCSELTEGLYGHIGIRLPDGSQNQFNYTVPVPLETYSPADLVFFGRGGNSNQIYHVGLVYDKDQVLEARAYDPNSSFPTGKVILRPLAAWMRYKNFCGIRSHPRLI